MLEKFREWSNSWVAKILLGILVLSFGLFFGMTDIFQGRHPLAVVATVGEAEISIQELRRSIEQQIQTLEQTSGQRFSPQQLAQWNIPGRVLAQLIHESLLDQEISKMKLTISDDQIRQAIQKDARFQEQKVFSPILFERFLRAQGLHEKAYVALLRKQLKRAQFTEALLAPLQLPSSLVQLFLQAQLQKRYGAYVAIHGKDQKITELPDEKTLEEFYKKYTFLFRVPEKRSFTLLRLSKGREEKEKEQTAAQQEALYALGRKVDDALASGETLEEVAKANDLPLIQVKKISPEAELENGTVDPSLSVNPVFFQAVLEHVFTAEAKTDTPVLRTPEGEPFVVRVDEIFPETTPSFKDIEARVQEAWIQAQQNLLAQKAAETLAQDIASGNVPAKGLIPLGAVSFEEKRAPDVPDAVFETLFRLSPGQCRAVPADTGAYVVRLLRLQQPTQAETKKRAHFEKDLLLTLKENILQGYIQNLKPLYPVKLNEKALQAVF